MFNINKLFSVIIILLITINKVPAAETDFASEIDQKLRGEFISREASLKEYRSGINAGKSSIKALHEEMRAAMLSDDRFRLQKVFRLLKDELEQMQESLLAQDRRIEQYRVSIYRALQTLDKKQPYTKAPIFNESQIQIGASLFEEMPETDKSSIGGRISALIEERKKLEIINELHEKLPNSPYGSPEGLGLKHRMLAMERLQIELERKQCEKLEAAIMGIVEIQSDGELKAEQITESDYGDFLRTMNNIIDTFPEEEFRGNPYSQSNNGLEQ